ncbi:MAG: HEAT repeat domain-containing protein [Acidobacteriales bacterium]|nr:HEAT repeat domain-containing protein [Terriglobales bacterium]
MRSNLVRIVSLFLLPLCLVLAQDPQTASPKERVKQARDLGKQGSQAIPELRKMLADRVTDVRIEAVKSIVEIGTQYSLDPLIQATKDNDPEVQIRATDGLVNFYLPGYVQTGLTASLKRFGSSIKSRFTDTNDAVIDPYIQVRPEVIAALGKLASGGSSMDARANAARAIGVLRGKAAIPDLAQALRSKDTTLMYECLIAMQKIRDKSASDHITFLLRDPDDRVQIAALETTGILQNRSALSDLRSALDRARNKKVARAALTAIAMMPEEQNRKIFASYIQDRDDGLRAAAAEGYGRLRNAGDLPIIEKAFNEERKQSPRLSQAFALVLLGRTEMTEFSPLQYLANTLNSSARQGEAKAFLIELSRDVRIRATLESFLPKGTSEEKIQLARILSISGDAKTLSALDTLSRDADANVAQEALRAVRALKARLQ